MPDAEEMIEVKKPTSLHRAIFSFPLIIIAICIGIFLLRLPDLRTKDAARVLNDVRTGSELAAAGSRHTNCRTSFPRRKKSSVTRISSTI
jgi:hypothetical protein